MYEKSVVILEANRELLEELKKGLSELSYRVLFAGDDGEVGLRQILEHKPDLILVGIFLKGCDGCVVIRETKKSFPKIKVIALGVASDALMERAMSEGADYYLVKPFTLSSAFERVNELVKEEDSRALSLIGKKKAVSLDEKISEIFISIGIPPHIKGYAYLREGIKTTVHEPYIINNVTKKLYPTIAEHFSTSPSKVERAIRHAIEVAWNRGRIDTINAVFGSRVYLGTEKPTNSEFIALVADKLLLENLVK